MNSKPMLFECMECRETYLADNLCDGYNCPKCNGHVVARGYIKEIEEGIKVTRDKINRAKENGLIRKYNKTPKINRVPLDGYIAELPLNRCTCGMDLASGKHSTVFTIHVNIDEVTNIDEVVRRFDKFLKTGIVDVIE